MPRLPVPLSTLCLSLVLGCTTASGASPAARFHSQDRWSVVGDSITQYGTYHAWVYLYQATRFPDAEFTVANCGISGDSAGGAVKRYEWDIKSTRPTVATIMLGMNDVSRELYAEGTSSPENLARRAGALANYRHNLEELTGLLRRDGVRLIFLTPSPFDENAAMDFPRLPGVNRALGECGKFMYSLAGKEGAALIDLNTQMTELNTRLQKENPKFSLIGPDRVHPGIPGHFVMAYFILHAQEVPATVSQLEVNAATREISARNATIETHLFSGDVIEFKCLEHALPYPVPDEARPALAWVPFQAEFNQQRFQVSGVSAGNYTLFIDEERIDRFSAKRLASGVNLAEFPATPQMHQAREVLKLVQEWQRLVANSQRVIAEVEHWKLPQVAHPVSFESVKAVLLTQLEQLKTNPGSHPDLDRTNIDRYLTTKPQEAVIVGKINELEKQIRLTARPVPHVFRIVRDAP